MTVVVTNPVERTRFIKFLVVGIIGAIVDFGVMNLLTSQFGTPLVIAGTISFICAVCSNFIWNRYWTYPDSRSRPIFKQLVMFFLVNIIGVAIRIPILHFLEPFFLSIVSNEVIAGDLQPWAGLRPATPSGRPLIGRTPLANLYVNVGHGALGWTLAAGSARLVCDLLARRAPTIPLAPFS